MKKLFCIILSALLLLSFSLCSCGDEEQSKPTDVSEKTSESEKSEPADVSNEESKKEESKEESKEVSEAHKHSYTEEITKEPTCTAKGEKTFKCECGDSYTEEIAAAGHKYKETVTKEATCVDTGEKELECSVCGKKETKEIKAAGHKYKEEVTKKATCTDDGVKEIKCSVCGDSKTEAIKATGHSWKNATCTDPKKCKNCGLTEGDALGHNFKDGKCSVCGAKSSVNINIKDRLSSLYALAGKYDYIMYLTLKGFWNDNSNIKSLIIFVDLYNQYGVYNTSYAYEIDASKFTEKLNPDLKVVGLVDNWTAVISEIEFTTTGGTREIAAVNLSTKLYGNVVYTNADDSMRIVDPSWLYTKK